MWRRPVLLLVVVLLALAERGAMIAIRPAELLEDRDAYLGLAESLHVGRGYSSPGSDQPTAYRPPLYPLLLSVVPQDQLARWVATVNLCCGVGVVLATWRLGLSLGLPERGAWLGAALVAIDPLLVRYASQPMTESLCVMLVTVWIWRLVELQRAPSVINALLCGVVFGLCALCRPTVWSSAALVLAGSVWWWWRSQRAVTGSGAVSWRTLSAVAVLGGAVVVGPWLVRNLVVLGAPVLTTTHGGYTLLLANNSAFYNEVVRQPWGTTWDGSHGGGQVAWMQAVEQQLAQQKIAGEVATDAWMNRQARVEIAEDIPGFLRACGLRFLWFWNVIPLGEARGNWPAWSLWSVGWFYSVLWSLFVLGLIEVFRQPDRLWLAGVLVILSFSVVHLFFWTNARMRAPVVPMVCLLAVRGTLRVRQSLLAEEIKTTALAG